MHPRPVDRGACARPRFHPTCRLPAPRGMCKLCAPGPRQRRAARTEITQTRQRDLQASLVAGLLHQQAGNDPCLGSREADRRTAAMRVTWELVGRFQVPAWPKADDGGLGRSVRRCLHSLCLTIVNISSTAVSPAIAVAAGLVLFAEPRCQQRSVRRPRASADDGYVEYLRNW
jgi:hypothetical protein